MRRESLIVNGRYMRCPRCRKENDILMYIPMGVVDEFRSETVPIYKCPECRWLLAPSNNAIAEIFSEADSA
jgi:DNA-directed RNA polymerase subunit RPC12/RpoP